jgi:protein-disulfide isomerase
MKRLIYSLVLVFTLAISANTVSAADNKDKKEMTAEQQVQLQRIVNRVEEIKAMDKSDLTKAEKSELKSELKELKKQARATGGGVYLSVGAIIIIILLLILIL